MKATTALLLAAAALSGCASVTPTKEIQQAFAIYDIKTEGVSQGKINDAVKTALQKNMSAVQFANGLPPSPLPEKAPRFKMVSPFKGSKFEALAKAQGQNLESPVCDDATLSANGRDSSMGSYGEGTTFFACVMPYQGGLSLNIHTSFEKTSGALSPAVLAATLMRPLVGDSSQFIPRTIKSIVEGVQATGAKVTLVESYPN